ELVFSGLSGGDWRRVNVLGIMKTIVSDARGEPQRVQGLPVIVGIEAEAVQAGVHILGDQDSVKGRVWGRPIQHAGGVSPAELVTTTGDNGVLVTLPDLLQFGGVGVEVALVAQREATG